MRSGYYLAYRPPEDYAERQHLVHGLAALGAVRLHYSLWRISPKIAKPVLQMLRGRHAVVLKRSRGVMLPSASPEKSADLGTVAIIAYRLPQWSPRKRVAISRALNSLPAMKVGRCLYMVPYLKASKIASYQGIIPTYSDLYRFLEKEGIEVAHMTHLRVVYPANQEPLLRAFVEAQVNKIERLIQACHRLKEVVKLGELNDTTRKLLSANRRRYKLSKGIVFFLHREMGIDLRPNLKRAYVALMSCRVLIESKALL
jgi:hypothetical protein